VNTTFVINGGAGRVLTAIPALEKFARLNPDNDFKVLVYGWENLYWNHPVLQKRTFGAVGKGTFDLFIKNNELIVPEPYLQHAYYNQHLSLAEAFDVDINKTNDHTDINKPNLYISTYEQINIRRIIAELKEQHKKNKLVIVQPYGSTMTMNNGRPFDTSHRSIDVDDYIRLISKIDKNALVVYFGNPEFRHPADDITPNLNHFNPDLRMFMSFISECDYFVGCDSVGQHMARAFNKPGSIIMGSTFEKNVSYPDHFRILRKKGFAPTYSPLRLPGVDGDFADRSNDGIMSFSETEINEFANIINLDLNEC
jgi:hypothetical protein